MGQYYYGVLLDAESKKPVAASYCGKLTESDKSECKAFMDMLHGKQYRVAWAGDYSKTKYSEHKNMYDYISELEESLPSWSQLIGESMPDSLYLLNISKHEAVDAEAFTEDLNLLALLCCDPTCRCLGGGDYFFREGFNDVGRWHGDVISASANLPIGYTLIPVDFRDWGHCTPIWEWCNIPDMLMGDDNYCSYGPNASDFTHQLLCDGAIYRWALADAEDIRVEFRKWVKTLPDPELVYKAMDKAKRVIKTSRKNIESYMATLRPYSHNPDCEYKCLLIDGVYVVLDEKDGELRIDYPRAFVNGCESSFTCNAKSRRQYRKYYKRMLNV